MPQNSRDIRTAIEARWREYLSRYGNLFSSDSLSGASPPSVFVGSYSYPKVLVGPMVPPMHGDTALLDAPERWVGKGLEEIVNYRLNLVRGVQKMPVENPSGRYIESLQEVAMASGPTDSEIQFTKSTAPIASIDGESAPFGPIGEIKSASYSGATPERQIERAYYDRDLKARDAVLGLYNSGIEISKIQRCFSLGMVGHKRRLVPTRWSITATDDMVSDSLVAQVLEHPVLDHYRVFGFEHLGNLFSVILFPHRWLYEMIEAWYSGGVLGFGSDYEDARGIDHPPVIAGAYFAAKLGAAEYLARQKIQAGVLILREIRPEYAVPVGVWQVREGVREAMRQAPEILDSFEESLQSACKRLSVSGHEWLARGSISRLLQQKTLSDYF